MPRAPRAPLLPALLPAAALSVPASPWPGCPLPPPGTAVPEWCDAALPFPARAAALAANLSLPEKAALLAKPGRAPVGSQTGPVPRLGIPVMKWWHEALHGVFWPGCITSPSGCRATSWPAVIGVAASGNTSLFGALGELTGTEGRAMVGVQADFWTPVLNLLREPRWGRAQESPGEDPHLNSEYGVAFVSGLQGDDPKYLRVASTLKHFIAYDAPENNPSRQSFDAKITQQDLADSYFPAFQAAIQQGKAAGAMCSYNAVNGVPMCLNPILNSMLRKTWGMDGYVVSDCNAVDHAMTEHHYTTSWNETIAQAYSAGMDLYNCGNMKSAQLEAFMRENAAQEAVLTTALRNLLEVQFRLGFFDPPELNPYSGLSPKKDIDTPQWRRLAKEAADQSLVLLVNRDRRLPLQRGRRLALIGPHANATTAMQGNYHTPIPPFLVSPFEGFAGLAPLITSAKGCGVTSSDGSGIAAAAAVARAAEDVVVVVGLDSGDVPGQGVESEGRDRTSLLLPGVQDRLIAEVAAAAAEPITVLIMSGGPVDVSAAAAHPKVGAVMWVGYPGQSGGHAIADAVMGVTAPAGRLPMTWYFENITKQVQKTQMGMRPDPETGYPGRTYRFFTGPVLFEFGHGLHYTDFSYEVQAPEWVDHAVLAAELSRTRHAPHLARRAAEVAVAVRNTGAAASPVVVMLFAAPPAPGGGAPRRQLRRFARLPSLRPGASATARFALTAHDLALAGGGGASAVVRGVWRLTAGGAAAPLCVTDSPHDACS